MTTSQWDKVFKQLDHKPTIKEKYIKHNKPKERAHGIATRKCRYCGTYRAHINKYGVNLCRHCFRQFAKDLGFKKFR